MNKRQQIERTRIDSANSLATLETYKIDLEISRRLLEDTISRRETAREELEEAEGRRDEAKEEAREILTSILARQSEQDRKEEVFNDRVAKFEAYQEEILDTLTKREQSLERAQNSYEDKKIVLRKSIIELTNEYETTKASCISNLQAIAGEIGLYEAELEEIKNLITLAQESLSVINSDIKQASELKKAVGTELLAARKLLEDSQRANEVYARNLVNREREVVRREHDADVLVRRIKSFYRKENPELDIKI